MNTRTLAVLLALPLAALAAIAWQSQAHDATAAGEQQAAKTAAAQSAPAAAEFQIGPGPSPPDRFYPGFVAGRDKLPTPVRGGRVVVHLASAPKHLNYMIDNSSVTRRMLLELHEQLVSQDLESWQYVPVLATGWETEDTLVLAGGAAGEERTLFGRVEDLGERWRVTPLSRGGSALAEPRELAKSEVLRIERETVFTFHLRRNVKWHDGEVFDARDVDFSFQCFKNPDVQCDEKRFQFDKIVRDEVLDPLTVRFFFAKQYFLALDCFEALVVLPAHLYDLSDPRNPDKKESATQAEQARFVNENPHNRQWIGLGPYRVKEWTSQYLDAERFPDYFDPAHAGYVDAIRWRIIPNDDAAATALLNGELDYFDRLTSEDFFGGRSATPEFRAHLYKGYFYAPYMAYTAWNMKRPQFADARVRRALAMCFDSDKFIQSYYKGLALRVTSEQFCGGPTYDRSIVPIAFDPDRARELFTEAGWYDRDGDGLIDKDGAPLSIEFLYPAGNKTSEVQGTLFQETLGRVGVRLELASRDWAAFSDRVQKRDFDCMNLGWIMPPQTDPEQSWHSRWADNESANHAGLKDPEVDHLIEAIQVELDASKRKELFSKLQRRVYDLQPYMFGVNPPRKFAMSLRVRNFQTFGIDPGYSIRRWFLVPAAAGTGESKGR